jgi:hypothetical protein
MKKQGKNEKKRENSTATEKKCLNLGFEYEHRAPLGT